jgi:hypothetical protein
MRLPWPEKLTLVVFALVMGFFLFISMGMPAPAYTDTTLDQYWSAAAVIAGVVALKVVLPVWIIARIIALLATPGGDNPLRSAACSTPRIGECATARVRVDHLGYGRIRALPEGVEADFTQQPAGGSGRGLGAPIRGDGSQEVVTMRVPSGTVASMVSRKGGDYRTYGCVPQPCDLVVGRGGDSRSIPAVFRKSMRNGNYDGPVFGRRPGSRTAVLATRSTWR